MMRAKIRLPVPTATPARRLRLVFPRPHWWVKQKDAPHICVNSLRISKDETKSASHAARSEASRMAQ
jgi:hypothetical protein